MRGWVLALAMVATPAAAADQFDLVCTAKKASERYRVDLAKGEWCFGECKNVMKIASVTSGQLVLSETKPVLRGDPEGILEINRHTGGWRRSAFLPRLDIVPTTTTGICASAPFSGFPAAKF